MVRKVALTILGLVIVVLALGAVKGLQISALIAQAKSFAPPPESVSATTIESQQWQPTLSAVGSIAPVQGVNVSAEVSGVIRKIAFESGAVVKKGDLLLALDTAQEQAALSSAEAQAQLKKLNFERTIKLREAKVTTPAEEDTARAEATQADAQVRNIQATIAQKTIRAPFAGRLGIRQINVGEFLNAGSPVVSLQSFDPVYVDFSLPQNQLSKLKTGLSIELKTDALSTERFSGTLTTINSEVDAATRNIKLQGTLRNPKGLLRTGMFVEASVVLPETKKVIAVPTTAIIYAPYGDSVYVVEQQKDKSGTKNVVRQQFVRLGETRGDLAEVISGLSEGQQVVTGGGFKLRTGSQVVIQKDLAPKPQLAPNPPDT